MSKRKRAGDIKNVDYNNVEYVDPNFVKISKLDRQPRNYEAYQEIGEGVNKNETSYYKDRDAYNRGYER